MKRIIIAVCAALVLSGCAAEGTFETLSDDLEYIDMLAKEISVTLPDDATQYVLQSDTAGSLYLCNGYTVTTYTRQAGDLNATLLEATGFSRDSLEVVETAAGEWKCYSCVWSCAGEGEEQIGRVSVLDDGYYHYVLSAMGNASQAGKMQDVWNSIFDSFTLTNTV